MSQALRAWLLSVQELVSDLRARRPRPSGREPRPGGEPDRQPLGAIDDDRAQQDGCAVELDAGGVAEQLVVEEPEFSPGESSAETEVLTPAEGQVPVWLPAHVKLVRFREYTFVPVG